MRGRVGLADLVDDIDAVVWEADPATFAFTYVSKACERMFGYPATAWLAPGFWAEHIHPDDRAAAVALCDAATRQGLDHEFEYRMIAADGATRWVRDLVRVGIDRAGRVTRLRGVLFDQTAARQAADALRESEQRFRVIFESTTAGLVLMTLDGTIISANESAARMVGYRPEEVRGQRILAFSHPDEHAETRRVLDEVASGRQDAVVFEARYMHRDGQVVTALVSCALIPQPGSGEPCIIGQIQDVTERRALQRQLISTQRLEAVGRLAGGVAHDFNNVLMVVKSYAELLADDLRPDDPHRADVLEIRRAADTGADLTRQLLAFSRQQVIEPKLFSLSAHVATLERLLRRLLPEHVAVSAALGDPSPVVRMDPGQIEQIVMNLVVNARDAMPDGGTLTLQVTSETIGADASARAPAGSPGRYAVLVVRDTGVGMDAATLARIFEPYFSTKAQGRGTGLGLSTVYGIVQQNGGFILVESEPGSGSTFQIYLPASDAGPDGRDEATGAGGMRGTATVLVVEDSPPVRGAARAALERYGYQVIVAADGQAAIDAAARHPGPIHLVLTDVVMPGMPGREVAREIAAIRPEARVLFMSGHPDDEVVRHGVLDGTTAYIAKPFAPSALARKVRSVIDG